jgi:hypothetical protein
MRAADVSETLELTLKNAGLDRRPEQQRPRLLNDNGPNYVASELSEWLHSQGMEHTRGKPYRPMTPGQDRALP